MIDKAKLTVSVCRIYMFGKWLYDSFSSGSIRLAEYFQSMSDECRGIRFVGNFKGCVERPIP